jgi:hypothetical protein
MAELNPSSPLTKESKQTNKRLMNTKETQKRHCRTSLLHPLARELPDVGSRQEVHHRFGAFLHGEQLRDLHVSASARLPARCLPHRFPERLLLVFPSPAVAEEVFPCLDRSTSIAAPPAFAVVSVPEPFQVRAYWRVPGLQSIELGRQWLHTSHWDRSHAPGLALQFVAAVPAAPVGLHCALATDLNSEIRQVLFATEVYIRSRTVLALRPSRAKFAW